MRSAVGHQQNDSTPRVSALIERFDCGAECAAYLRIGETSAGTAGGYTSLHHRSVLCERHHAQRTIAEVHEREPVLRTPSDECREQVPRNFRFLAAATHVIKQQR